MQDLSEHQCLLKREQTELSLKASLVWSLCDLEREILFVECQVYKGATEQRKHPLLTCSEWKLTMKKKKQTTKVQTQLKYSRKCELGGIYNSKV